VATHLLDLSYNKAPDSADFRADDAFARAIAPAPRFAEIFTASNRDAAASGFLLSQIGDLHGAMLWVQDRTALRYHGRPFPHWRRGTGPPCIHVVARNAGDALWAMEEGLRCAALSAVIGEIAGNPRALDFTATRRLAVASEKYGVPAFLLRIDSAPDLSGARMRWRVASRPSLAPRWNHRAPGAPVWSLELFRARDARPGDWEAAYDRAAHRLDPLSPSGDAALAQGERRAG